MGGRLRALTLLVVLVGVGVLLGSSISQWWQEAPGPVAEPAHMPPPQGRVRVEILNGGGQSGVAREATSALRDLRLDVVYYGNARTFSEDSSVVMDRVGRLDAARFVADALNIRTVRSEPDSNLFVDVTVRLGPEWTLPESSSDAESTPPPWWDIRRFFGKAAPAADSTGSQNSTGR